MPIEFLSIELTNRCDKGCGFCYNGSGADGDTRWTAEEAVAFVMDCAKHGTKAVSFGGGEPMLFPGLIDVLGALQGKVFRSITTNGLMLADADQFARLVSARPDKVHVSIHRPASAAEVSRVVATVRELQSAGIESDINLLVAADGVAAATQAARTLRDAGIDNTRIVYLPQRGTNTPTPRAIGALASGPFQSTTCLTSCRESPRFCSVSWDKTAARCSYTSARRRMHSLSHQGMIAALEGLGITHCGVQARIDADPAAQPPARPRQPLGKSASAPAERLDYPAAHSMDTTWFAVDDAGEIAWMNSGEPGPVPVGVRSQFSFYDLIDYLGKDEHGIPLLPVSDPFPDGPTTRELTDFLTNPPEPERNWIDGLIAGEQLMDFVVWLADPRDVEVFRNKWLTIIRIDPSRPIYHIMSGSLAAALSQREKHRLLAWRRIDYVDDSALTSLYGFHLFEAEWGHKLWDQFAMLACPPSLPPEYARVATPPHPRLGLPAEVITVEGIETSPDEAPERFRVVIPLPGARFADTASIQIADFVPSYPYAESLVTPDSADATLRRHIVIALQADSPVRDRQIAQWRHAAEQGDLVAQQSLACLYRLGNPRNDAKAFHWWRIAAELADATPVTTEAMFENGSAAQCNLADMYEHGIGTPKDDAQALLWYAKSALRGNPVAQRRLSMMYNGYDDRGNVKRARRRLAKVVEQGPFPLRDALRKLEDGDWK